MILIKMELRKLLFILQKTNNIAKIALICVKKHAGIICLKANIVVSMLTQNGKGALDKRSVLSQMML